MPQNGITDKPDLATATANLEDALDAFSRALRAAPLPRGDVFDSLRQWRSNEARSKGLPPYIIATDAMLRAIEKARPTDVEQLAAVKGVGQNRANTYGQGILAVLAATPPLVEA